MRRVEQISPQRGSQSTSWRAACPTQNGDKFLKIQEIKGLTINFLARLPNIKRWQWFWLCILFIGDTEDYLPSLSFSISKEDNAADVCSLEMQTSQKDSCQKQTFQSQGHHCECSFPWALVNISVIYWLTQILGSSGNKPLVLIQVWNLSKVLIEGNSKLYCRNLQIAFEDILTVKPR